MTIEILAAAIGIIASVVTTTIVVVSKITRVEVMLAELRATMSAYEHRIAELERKVKP